MQGIYILDFSRRGTDGKGNVEGKVLAMGLSIARHLEDAAPAVRATVALGTVVAHVDEVNHVGLRREPFQIEGQALQRLLMLFWLTLLRVRLVARISTRRTPARTRRQLRSGGWQWKDIRLGSRRWRRVRVRVRMRARR